MAKAQALKLAVEGGYVAASLEEATHLKFNMPGPTGILVLPVILKGKREGTNAWTWNGNLDAPTLRPSILTKGHDFRCHTWMSDGKVQFLDDSSHEFKGQMVDLLDLPTSDSVT